MLMLKKIKSQANVDAKKSNLRLMLMLKKIKSQANVDAK